MSPLRLNGSTSGAVTLDCPAVGGNNTLVLPGGNGSSQQVLATNGSGALSWSNRPILQVVSTTKTDTFTTTTTLTTSSNGAQITGLTATITPASASNKILVMANVTGAGTSGTAQVLMRLYRDSTAIGNPANVGNRPGVNSRFYFADANVTTSAFMMHLDSPGITSAITYSIYIGPDAAGTIYVNRNQNDADSTLGARTSSVITVMEVAA